MVLGVEALVVGVRGIWLQSGRIYNRLIWEKRRDENRKKEKK